MFQNVGGHLELSSSDDFNWECHSDPESTLYCPEYRLTEPAGIFTLLNGINLPDASNYNQLQGGNPDPWKNWLCLAAMEIEEQPNGPLAWLYGNATPNIKVGDANAQEIGYWTPTRQIKPFYSRNPGMALYRDAIVEKIDALMTE